MVQSSAVAPVRAVLLVTHMHKLQAPLAFSQSSLPTPRDLQNGSQLVVLLSICNDWKKALDKLTATGTVSQITC